jgi:hypothetical protein
MLDPEPQLRKILATAPVALKILGTFISEFKQLRHVVEMIAGDGHIICAIL